MRKCLIMAVSLLMFMSSCEKDELLEDVINVQKTTDSHVERKERMAKYVDSLNNTILLGTAKTSKITSLTARVSSQSFYIQKGNTYQTVYLALGSGGFSGFPVKVYNNSGSSTDVNYSVYKLNANGTLGTNLGGKWDVHAGQTATTYCLSSDFVFSGSNIAVVLENDGYFWQTNVPVYGTVTTP